MFEKIQVPDAGTAITVQADGSLNIGSWVSSRYHRVNAITAI
jgi:hypothetical protein